ncbi:MAG TPA: GatB/YqeY domain-containing protein [Candidatus Thiothrix moscowensis]|uniref:GatB/YqeY domain-containing protein n=1 Tax=unclassified Thiothrix TaxID=2636184 RepID=UPI0025E29771|nr:MULTISPECIES: GatB/YqeY domain-containing protein [unclassified Thiothrix]HRJ51718.1 GatB/YqeY domain-containing protein [Candidatus Thiothrix moscowensis]HRJ92033.1 GatB/YqeY domain-containing protein [Candidatus Thiothrix moscowensis]
MTDASLKTQISEDMKSAMRAQDKPRLGVIRLMLAAIKQLEVDTRTELDESAVLAVLDKMVKQRRESIRQYQDAGRTDLADQEEFELGVIQAYLPQPLTEDELYALIQQGIAETGAVSVRDMGKVMNWLKPLAQGRADMGKLSGMIKARLGT